MYQFYIYIYKYTSDLSEYTRTHATHRFDANTIMYIHGHIGASILAKTEHNLYEYIYSTRPRRRVAIVAWLQAICDINVWAWEGMPAKLGRWAWLATGYASEAEMAAFWRVNVSKVGFCGTRKHISSAW